MTVLDAEPHRVRPLRVVSPGRIGGATGEPAAVSVAVPWTCSLRRLLVLGTTLDATGISILDDPTIHTTVPRPGGAGHLRWYDVTPTLDVREGDVVRMRVVRLGEAPARLEAFLLCELREVNHRQARSDGARRTAAYASSMEARSERPTDRPEAPASDLDLDVVALLTALRGALDTGRSDLVARIAAALAETAELVPSWSAVGLPSTLSALARYAMTAQGMVRVPASRPALVREVDADRSGPRSRNR